MSNNKVDMSDIIFVQTGVDKNRDLLVGFFIKKETKYPIRINEKIVIKTKLADLKAKGILIATQNEYDQVRKKIDLVSHMEIFSKMTNEELAFTKEGIPKWFLDVYNDTVPKFQDEFKIEPSKIPEIVPVFRRVARDLFGYGDIDMMVIVGKTYAALMYLAKIKRLPPISPVESVAGLGSYQAKINAPVLAWFANLAEISDMKEHAFVWQPGGFASKGYIQQEKFAFNVFLNSKDKTIFEQFQAPGPKAAFFHKLKIAKNVKSIDLSSSDEKIKGSETVEARLQEIANMVDSAFEYGIERDHVTININMNAVIDAIGFSIEGNPTYAFVIEKKSLYLYQDEYPELISSAVIDHDDFMVSINAEKYMAMFRNSPVLESTTLKLATNGMYIIECSNKSGSRARFMGIGN